jgi:penicillin-binding protein 2
MFGLGQKTGVELTEATGVVASKENREAMGGIWYPGNTVQAAIGQSDNLFTPIQLCSYVATLANGGTRYKAHFIKSIKSYDYSETIYEAEPVVLNTVNASRENFAAVRTGMISMANSLAAFQGLDYKVASKTGTAQAKKKVNGVTVAYTNGFMISYAPADNPQIAVVIAIENVDSSGLGNYVREVYDAYFNRNSDVTESQQSGVILR